MAAAGLDEAELDARILLGAATGLDPAALLTRDRDPLGADAAERLDAFAARRLAREPVARILATREFWGLSFGLSAATLVPRPDTETVVEAALRSIPDRGAPLAILDLGTGSGAILLALLSELPDAWGVGIDRSEDAAATARTNARALGLSDRAAFLVGDWAASLDRRFDLVVSNPPYIPAAHLADLDPEVRGHDPAAALDGGPDGLSAYRAILAGLAPHLAPGGRAVFEIGFDQAEAVGHLAREAGYDVTGLDRDLGGHPRALTLVPDRAPPD